MGGARNLADGIARGIFGHRLFQRESAFERTGLFGGPGANAAAARTCLEIVVRFGIGDDLDGAAQPHLAAQTFPVKAHGSLFLAKNFAAFLALEIGVEDETVVVESLQENHADIGKTILIDRCQRHCIGVVGLGRLGFFQPFGKELEGFATFGKVTAC